MKKLLLITGDIAAGKSTFSKILAERYRVAVFQKDTVKEILGDSIGFRDREENKRLSNAAVETMCHIFIRLRQRVAPLFSKQISMRPNWKNYISLHMPKNMMF